MDIELKVTGDFLQVRGVKKHDDPAPLCKHTKHKKLRARVVVYFSLELGPVDLAC